MAYVGMVIMQGSRPGNCCLEPLFKALHHLSCQLLHAKIAFDVLLGRVRTQFEAVEIPPLLGHLINELVGFESAYRADTVKKRPGEFLLVSAWSLLDVADIGLCSLPLSPPLSDIISFDYCHLLKNITSPRPLSNYSVL